MTINEIQDEVISEFADFDDWMDKYQMLIDLGNELGSLDEKYKTEQNLIDGCQSRVWLQCAVPPRAEAYRCNATAPTASLSSRQRAMPLS